MAVGTGRKCDIVDCYLLLLASIMLATGTAMRHMLLASDMQCCDCTLQARVASARTNCSAEEKKNRKKKKSHKCL